jgi:hypothetical protein
LAPFSSVASVVSVTTPPPASTPPWS